MTEAPLVTKLRELAVKSEFRMHAAELFVVAMNLQSAIDALPGEDRQTESVVKSLVGNWSRARRLYCKLTGEALLP